MDGSRQLIARRRVCNDRSVDALDPEKMRNPEARVGEARKKPPSWPHAEAANGRTRLGFFARTVQREGGEFCGKAVGGRLTGGGR